MKTKISFLFLGFVSLLSCKKETTIVPDCLVGNWKHIKTHYSYNSYYPVSVPFPTSGGSVLMPTDQSFIEIRTDGYLKLLKNNQTLMYEDFFTTTDEANTYKVHYYGTPESKSTDYFYAQCKSDTLIVYSFFPYKSHYEHTPGSHGGISTNYNYANYFLRQ